MKFGISENKKSEIVPTLWMKVLILIGNLIKSDSLTQGTSLYSCPCRCILLGHAWPF